MATVTGESLKSELEMFDVLYQDDSALDKSKSTFLSGVHIWQVVVCMCIVMIKLCYTLSLHIVFHFFNGYGIHVRICECY